MFRNHSYLHHRYSIGFALFLMTLHSRFHVQGGARGQDLEDLRFFFINIIKDPSRTEDLTLNVRDQVLD